jgi:hypothetical protein
MAIRKNALILFFDVFIISETTARNRVAAAKAKKITPRERDERLIRDACYSYRFQSKLTVCKYVIASYSYINWDDVVIRFECEDQNDVHNFESFCRSTFPNAKIETSRSDNAVKYAEALLKLKSYGDPWIFFSPNNDHPFIGSVNYIDRYLELATEMENKFPEYVVSILYSHFTESMNINSPSKRLWGDYRLVFPKMAFEDDFALVLEMNKFCCDSIEIFRLDTLLDIFTKT